MFFGWGKDFFKKPFVNISSPVPSINNVQSLSFGKKIVVDWAVTMVTKQKLFQYL